MSFFEKYFPWLFEYTGVSDDKDIGFLYTVKKQNVKTRQALARSERTDEDVLDVLADDEDVSIRRAVAGNPQTPARASARLAKDPDDDVRFILAKRLVKLLPTLSINQHAKIYTYTVQALGVLAEDRVTNIRVALSSSLKDVAHTPHSVARTLAQDLERAVSEPILRYSLMLTDEDLLDIIKRHKDAWRMTSIASRPRVSEFVSEAIADKDIDEATATLLENNRARIRKATLKRIIRKAEDSPVLKEAMVERNKLPKRLNRKITFFVDQIIESFLRTQVKMDSKTITSITETTKRRMDWVDDKEENPDESPLQHAKRLKRQGRLTEDVVLDALSWGEVEFVMHAIALRGKIDYQTVKRIIDLRSAKAILAICWRAKLRARTAHIIQKRVAKMPVDQILHPRGGEKYPISKTDIEWQLDFFDIT